MAPFIRKQSILQMNYRRKTQILLFKYDKFMENFNWWNE